MAADLYIHIVTPEIDESVLADFFSNSLGSKWFNPKPGTRFLSDPDSAWGKISATPAIWVGEVSWLKAGLFNDPQKFVPQPVLEVNELIGEDLPVIDDVLIARIRNALRAPNTTSYSVSDTDAVLQFLVEHKGERCFTISW